MPNLNLKPGKISPNQFEGFGVSLATNKSTYSVSEPIIIKLKVFNHNSEEISFHFRSSQRSDSGS